MARLLLSEPILFLHIQALIDPAEQKRDEELHSQQDHDGDLPGNVVWCIFGLEDFRSNDVPKAERRQGNRVDGVLCDSDEAGVVLDGRLFSYLFRVSARVASIVGIHRRECTSESTDKIRCWQRAIRLRLRPGG